MSKITKKELRQRCIDNETAIASLESILKENGIERQPQLKQLDQSVFDGLDEKWKSAATNTDGKAYLHNMPKSMMYFNHSSYGWCSKDYDAHEMQLIGDGFDPSGFAVGFIERDDMAKEPAEVDLSGELTGSDLCRAMLARGDGYVVCLVSNVADSHAIKNREHTTLIEQWVERDGFYNYRSQNWGHAVPANPATNEPLTASEAGF